MKKLVIGLAGVFVFVLIVVSVGVFNLGTIVTFAVNTYGPDIVKTPVTVETADVAVFDGRVGLENFKLGNPHGFSSPYAVTVKSAFVDVDEATLLEDTIIIDRIEISQPLITYEIKGTTDNFRALIQGMKKPGDAAARKPPEEKSPPQKQGKKIVIRELVLTDITIKTAAAMAGGEIATTHVSEIRLSNIGQKQAGVSAAEAVLLVLNELYGQVLSGDVLNQLKTQLKGLGKEFEGVRDEVKSLGGQLKGLFDR